MAIVKTDVPMTPELYNRTVQLLAEKYPFLGTEVLTNTAYGRPVWAITLGTGERRVIYSGAHHANEWITTTLLLKFAEDCARAYQTNGEIGGCRGEDLWREATINLVPMVNPDGVALVTGELSPGSRELIRAEEIAGHFPQTPFPEGWKANLKGVDLNLQYPAGWMLAREIKFSEGYDRPAPRDYVGRAPLNQRESLALAEYTEEIDPALVMAYHTQGQVIYWRFRDYQVPGAKALAEEFARLSGYALAEVPYESGFAGYKDWFIQNFRRPGFTIEAGLGENPLPITQFDEIYRQNLGILLTAAMG